jgi:hypothetical protein
MAAAISIIIIVCSHLNVAVWVEKPRSPHPVNGPDKASLGRYFRGCFRRSAFTLLASASGTRA